MNLLKNLKIIILVLVVLLILILVRNSDQNVFREHAETAIEATNNNSNIITARMVRNLTIPYLVIDLGGESKHDSLQFQHSIDIPFEKLLEKPNRAILDQTNGTLILFSGDIAIASKAWVILNQLGYKKVMILTDQENPEELKYKFQRDTTARLELDSI
jgi:hypothetical protein